MWFATAEAAEAAGFDAVEADPGARPRTSPDARREHGRDDRSDEPAAPTGDGGLVRVRVDLGYDGTAFAGWARQPGQRTVQGELETALATILRSDPPPTTTVAGRTDAGVHARGQVCHVDVDAEAWTALPGRSPAAPAESLVHRLSGLLPPDIRVHHAVRCRRRSTPGSPRSPGATRTGSATTRPCRPVAPRCAAARRSLDVAAMDAAAAPLVGEHDFAAFCKPREGATTIRRVLSLRCARDADGLVVVDIQADAFCHHMVRAIVGALVAVGEGRRAPSWPGQVLAAGERDSAVTVLPPGGLTLESVTYPPDDELAARAAVTAQVRVLAG